MKMLSRQQPRPSKLMRMPWSSSRPVNAALVNCVFRLFVRRALFDDDQAVGMLAWPHSGFHVHTAVWIPEDDRAFAKRLARYCARNPVALERLTYDRAAKAVTYRSDKSEGPTAGTESADPLEFLARVLTHIPDKGQVTTRYYGWYANRPRGMRRRAEPAVDRLASRSWRESTTDRQQRALPHPLRVSPRAPAHRSGPFGVRGGPEWERSHGVTTRRSADRTAREAGTRVNDPTRTAREVVARRAATRHTSTTPE
jgi:hypothetical protein